MKATVEAVYEGRPNDAKEAQHEILCFDNRNMKRAAVSTQASVYNCICEAFKPDKSYLSIWKRFKVFLSTKRDSGTIDDAIVYLTRQSIGLFF